MITLYQKVDSYIKKVIQDVCDSENRENDVEYQFCILDDNIIFQMKTKYNRVYFKTLKRLEKNCYKNFKLFFNQEFDFDIYEGVDTNFSICRWDVFGKFATIRAHSFKTKYLAPYVKEVLLRIIPSGEHMISKHVEELMKLNGITDFEKGFHYPNNEQGWNQYLNDYKKLYNEELKSYIICN